MISNIIIILITIIILLFLFYIIYVTKDSINIKFHKIKYDKHTINKLINSENKDNINIYYINLNKSIDRKNRFLKRLPKNIIPVRIEAVSPDTLPNINLPLLCNDLRHGKKILACTASHLKAIHTAYHSKEEYAFISEDDVIIKKNIDWNYLIKLAPKDFDIIQIHTCCLPFSTNTYNPIYKYNKTETLYLKVNDKMIPSAAFYIVSKQGMIRILEKYINNFRENNWDKIKQLDFSKNKKGCEADRLIFKDITRYICTLILIDVEGIDSTLSPLHLISHKTTKEYLKINNR